MKKLSIVAIILSCIAIGGQIFIFATQKENSDELYSKALQSSYKVFAPVLPDTLSFAGEKVPLQYYYVRECLDRELMVNMYWQSNMLLWMKRAGRFFPIIEPILKEEGVPDDFKYLCVIESGLSNVTSPAQASGYWQFLKSTGQNYGLEINSEIDMRWNIEASTHAACRYLKSAYRRFGSWTDAAASYNCGEAGLQKRIDKQEVDSYYHVRLNNETTRYVYRILAVKLIMKSPQNYGFYLRKCDLYPTLAYKTEKLSGRNVDMYKWCKEHGINYKVLREYNPWLQTETLTNKDNKTYEIKLPTENALTSRSKSTEMVTSL